MAFAAPSSSPTIEPQESLASFSPISSPIRQSCSTIPRPPVVRGLFTGTRAPHSSISISSVLGNSLTEDYTLSPSDTESRPLSPASTPLSQEPGGPRRKLRGRASRIARPKDALPFARHRAARASARFSRGRGARLGRAGGAGVAVPVLDRSQLAPSFGLKSTTLDNDDGTGCDRQIELDMDLTPVDAPLCLRHGEACQRLMCKRGPNSGKYFFKCAKPQYQQCDFFKWEHEIAASDRVHPLADDDISSVGDLPEWHPAPALVGEPDADVDIAVDVDQVLRDMFGFSAWRPGQREAVSRVLAGCSALAVLPTAGGKSLIYQVVAAMRSGLVVVISPLIALIHSQQANVPAFLSSAVLTSSQSPSEGREIAIRVREGKIKILFVAPERAFAPTFRRLFSADVSGRTPPVALVAVDEAHCVSQWGHNFRTAYLRLPAVLFGSQVSTSSDTERPPLFGRGVPILALTATATSDTEKDICRYFQIDTGSGVIRNLSAKQNLVLTLSSVSRGVDAKALELVHRLAEDPFASILGIVSREKLPTSQFSICREVDSDNGDYVSEEGQPVRKRKRTSSVNPDENWIGWGSNINVTKSVGTQKRVKPRKSKGCIIVYVNKQRDCESVRNFVSSSSLHLGGSVMAYHAGMSAQERSKVQSQFEKGQVALLVATVAFGMGIHCDRVAGVIHFDLPSSIEAYSQEVGRAGRDGQPGCCHLFFTEFDGSRLLSRAHSDGIDANSVRQVVCKLLDSSFKYRSLANDGSDSAQHGSDGKVKSVVGEAKNEERMPTDVGLEGQFVMSLSEDELCRTLDVKYETGEAIVAILESEVAGLQLLRKSHTTLTIKFFSETPEAMLESKSRGLCWYDKAVLALVVKFAKRSKGQYVVSCSKACVTESQIAPALRRMQSAGLLAYETSDAALVAKCTTECMSVLKNQTRELCTKVHDELVAMERVKVQKADALLRVLRKADGLLSDAEQDAFLHDALAQYFANGCEDYLPDMDEASAKVDESRLGQVRKAAEAVWDEEGCGGALARTGRQIARVLHGLDSGRLRAKDWWRCEMWGRFLDVDFECVRRVACDVVRERLRQRRNGSAS